MAHEGEAGLHQTRVNPARQEPRPGARPLGVGIGGLHAAGARHVPMQCGKRSSAAAEVVSGSQASERKEERKWLNVP